MKCLKKLLLNEKEALSTTIWPKSLLVPAKGMIIILIHKQEKRKKKEGDPKEQGAEKKDKAHPWFGNCSQEGVPLG